AEKPEHVFLSLHAVLYRDNNFFTCLDESLIAEYCPSVIVTFIDDIYDIIYRVNVQRERVLKTRSRITLPEALSWRSAEVMVGDIIARGLYVDPDTLVEGLEIPTELNNRVAKPVHHFVVVVKHQSRVLDS